jgi:hypothetical protein
MWLNSSAGEYEKWFAQAVTNTVRCYADGERLFFINAWNEWDEGCHLDLINVVEEPICKRPYGLGVFDKASLSSLSYR